jgi:spore germination protein KC
MASRRLLLSKLLLLILLPALTFFPGCWSLVQVDDLAIVRAMSVDYLPGRRAAYLVTLAVIRPGDIAGGGDAGAGDGATPTRLFTGIGATIDLALQQIRFNLSRRIYLSHNEVILINEDAAKHGLHSVTDFIMRNHEVRLTNFIVVVPGMAHGILNQTERMETGITDEILGLLNQATQSSEADPQEAYRILRQLSTPGQDTHLPVIQISPHLDRVLPEFEEEEQREEEEEEEQGSDGTENQVEPFNELSLDGTAVFRGDMLAGYLDHVETRGFLWITGDVQQTIIAVRDPGDPGKNVSLHVTRAISNITPIINNGKVSFRIEVEEEGDIAAQRSQENLATPEMIEKLNSAKAAAIKIEIEKTLRRLQELGSDIVGFGAMLNRKDPKTFKELRDQWPEVFREMEFDIHVTSNIRRTGQLSRPVPIYR